MLCTILAGGVQVWRHDIEIPSNRGRSMSGTPGACRDFPGSSTIPVMLDIAKDTERYCPEAIFLNCAGPAALCRAVQGKHKNDRLCHSPRNRRHAGRVDRRADGRSHLLGAGINHQAWYLSLNGTERRIPINQGSGEKLGDLIMNRCARCFCTSIIMLPNPVATPSITLVPQASDLTKILYSTVPGGIPALRLYPQRVSAAEET